MADKTNQIKHQKKDDPNETWVPSNGMMIHELKERVKELNCFYKRRTIENEWGRRKGHDHQVSRVLADDAPLRRCVVSGSIVRWQGGGAAI